MKNLALLGLVLLVGCSACGQKSAVKPKPAVKVQQVCKESDESLYTWQTNGISGEVEWVNKPHKCSSGKWILDEAAEKEIEDEAAADLARKKAEAKRRLDLWTALRTRVVTDEEMAEILELGRQIIPDKDGGGDINWCGGWSSCSIPSDYKEQEIEHAKAAQEIFDNALLIQFKIRIFSANPSKVCPRETK